MFNRAQATAWGEEDSHAHDDAVSALDAFPDRVVTPGPPVPDGALGVRCLDCAEDFGVDGRHALLPVVQRWVRLRLAVLRAVL